jgi:CheY-like chemotaxis protein
MTALNNLSTELSLKGARILIVEDEWIISNLLADLLVELGCEVVGPATHLAMANELASIEKIDCALLDLNIAGEPVYPVAEILSSRGVPFVFITGYRREKISESFRKRPLLRKPFKAEDLTNLLKDLMAQSER